MGTEGPQGTKYVGWGIKLVGATIIVLGISLTESVAVMVVAGVIGLAIFWFGGVIVGAGDEMIYENDVLE
jgi:hypothetical protein